MVDVLSLRALQVPPRPPTPPRSSSFQPASCKSDPNGPASVLKPGQLPSPPDLSPHPHSDLRSKKVNFSPLTSYIKPLDLSGPGTESHSPLRILPSSQSKPAKSILKSKPAPPSLSTELLQSPQSSPRVEDFAAMLESVTQQLAGESRVSRSDAYMQLLNSLTAYRDTPDTTLLCEKVASISQYIRRDISQKTIDPSNASDLSLVRQALNLLSMFMWKPEVSDHLPDEFKVFFLDHAITSLQDASLPKTLVVDYMRILSLQNFPARILTNSKASQLLSTLKHITERAGGKAAVALQLTIYEKLLHQARHVFVSQADTWIDNLVTTLLHKVKDVRVKAIRLGFQVATTIGPNTTISRAVQDVMDVPGDDESKFVDELSSRMLNMISGGESAAHVPQIWAAIVLLLRRSRWSIEQWTHLKKWLLIIQKCFNHSDSATKLQALIAWDRFVYTVRLDESTSHEMTKLLSRPILSQLERKKSDRPNSLSKQSMSSYYHLLYYAFRPSMPHDRVDTFWKEYILRPFSRALLSTSSGHTTACEILAAMFWNPYPKPWDDKKPPESSKLTPTDLPRLDFRWTRSHISTIVPVFELLFKTASWPEGNIAECPVGIAWTHFSKALAEASSKEIQPSSDTMQAVGSVVGLLHRIWKQAPVSLNVSELQEKDWFLAQFRFLATTIISHMGSLPFTDKHLLRASDDTFQTMSTPSHRHGTSSMDINKASIHLLRLILHPHIFHPDHDYHHLVRGIIEACLHGRSSWSARLDVLCQFSDTLDGVVPPESDAMHDYGQWVWKAISDLTIACLNTARQPSASLSGTPSLSSQDCDRVKKILSIGTQFSSLGQEWTALFASFATIVEGDRTDNVLIHIIEDLASKFSSYDSSSLPQAIPFVSCLLHHADLRHRKTKPDKRFLPMNQLPNSKQQNGTCVPFERLLTLTNNLIRDAYIQLPLVNLGDLLPLLERTSHFANGCPADFCPTLLVKLQYGFSFWLADNERKLTRKDGDDKSLFKAVQSLISCVLHLLETCERTDTALLQELEALVSSGLASSHKSVANSFIPVWNSTFGREMQLSYPRVVEKALRSLLPYADLQLPSFPRGDNIEADATLPDFIASQEDGLGSETPRSAPVPLDKSRRKSPVSWSLPNTPAKRTPPQRQPVSTPKPRLRHDDSQIQFVAVESSPTDRPETQALTEHQRDVRERQRTDASRLFSAIQSGVQSRQHSAAKRAPSPALPDQARGTPDLPPAVAANDDEVPFSSPTPGSKEQDPQAAQLAAESSLSSLLELNSSSDVEPPSSPPQQGTSPQDRTKRKVKRSTQMAALKDTRNETPNVAASAPDLEASRAINLDVDCVNETNLQTPPSGSKRKRGSQTDTRQRRSTSGQKRRQTEEPISADKGKSKLESELWRTGPYPMANRDAPSPSRRALPTNVDDHQDQERVSIIPDSFSDELEQQIASQLEQDLELSLDAELKRQNQQQQDDVPAHSTRSQKRKRGVDDGVSATNNQGKNGSAASNVTSQQLPDEDVVELDQEVAKPPSPKKRNRSRRKSKTSSLSPQQDQQSDANTSQALPPAEATTDPDPLPPALKRRSSRLRGQPADETDEQVLVAPQELPDNSKDDAVMLRRGEATGGNNVSPGPPAEPADTSVTDPRQIAVLVDGPKVETAPKPPVASPSSILSSLRHVHEAMKSVSFGESTLEEMDRLMFQIKKEAFAAERRHVL